MIIIGEKINGAIPSVATAIANRDEAWIVDLVQRQEAAGADYLDVCAGTAPELEYDALCWLIDVVQSVAKKPICIDSPDPHMLLKVFPKLDKPGLVNSISMEGDKCDVLLPLLKDNPDWGVIALCCDPKGIAEKAEDKFALAVQLVDLPVTYDPFFKAVFHPDVHPERLSSFISSLLGIQVKVKAILPSEDRLSDGDSLLIMDVLVELEDGSLTNVEIQKVPYAFPEGRMSCYSSDLVMRQYARARGERGKHFTYRDMKKVYTIIIFEKSTQVFHQIPQSYIHRGSTKFDTGLELSLLQEYCLVCLDVFREFPYAKDKNEQTAWLSFLLTETVEEAEKLVSEYPWLEEIYRELAMLRRKPEEVLGMFSDALKIMDQNTVKYMIDEQQQVMNEQKQVMNEQQKKINEQKEELIEKDRKYEVLKTESDRKKKEQADRIRELEALVAQK